MSREGERELRTLTVKLSAKERAKRADEFAEADEEIDRLAGEKKEEGARYNELIADAVEKKNRLRKEVRAGEEEKEVECEWRPDWTAKEWLLKRLDSGAVADRETMSRADLSPELDLEDGGGDGGGDGGDAA